MANLLAELYPSRAQRAFALEHGAARPALPGTDCTTWDALQDQIHALEQALPARWRRPDTPALDWCCPRAPGAARPGPARCGVCDADEDAARAALRAAEGEVPRGTP